MPGSRSDFDRRLEAIEGRVIELFALVTEDLPYAAKALLTGRRETIRALAGREQLTDALQPPT
jgi:hypothetical protein